MVVNPASYPPSHDPGLTPRQIVVLEHGGRRLYGEVIQVVVSRQRCWVRPLAYAEGPSHDSHTRAAIAQPVAQQVYDLQHGPDVIWPLSLFRAALDMDWLAMVNQLQHQGQPCDRPTANRLLRTLLNAVCQVQNPANVDCREIVPYVPPLPPVQPSS